MEMRLQRFLSQAGVASRRKAEEMITAGKVWVNGRAVRELGSKVDPARDKVTVDGQRVQQAPHAYFVMCKPKGYVTTRDDPDGRPTVMDLLGPRAHGCYPVGRLDFHTDGVLLVTNDGDLANALMHPSGGVPKTYHAKFRGEVTAETLQALRDGVVLDDGVTTLPAEVHLVAVTGRNTWLQITIRQGLNRQIHRMAEAVGHSVLKLSRVAYGPLSSEGLRPGEWRELSDDELDALRDAASGKLGKAAKAAAAKEPPRKPAEGQRMKPAEAPRGKPVEAQRRKPTEAPRRKPTEAQRRKPAEAPRGRTAERDLQRPAKPSGSSRRQPRSR